MSGQAERPADKPAGLLFRERMAGYVAFGEHRHAAGARKGRASETRLVVHLTITIDDLSRFSSDRRHRAKAGGSVRCEALGGTRPVERGTLDIFPADGPGDGPLQELMRYRILFRDAVGHPLTLVGIKVRRPGLRVWRDTSTLYSRVLWGHVDDGHRDGTGIVASGILWLQPIDFLHQLTTFRASDPTLAERLDTIGRFDARFLGHLWHVYGRQDGRLAGHRATGAIAAQRHLRRGQDSGR